MDVAEIRVAATRGFIASGVEGPQDTDAVVGMMFARGVRQEGQQTKLIAVHDGERTRVTTDMLVRGEALRCVDGHGVAVPQEQAAGLRVGKAATDVGDLAALCPDPQPTLVLVQDLTTLPLSPTCRSRPLTVPQVRRNRRTASPVASRSS